MVGYLVGTVPGACPGTPEADRHQALSLQRILAGIQLIRKTSIQNILSVIQ
jgi:hypothetical protein